MAKLPRSPISEGVTNQYRPVREARASGADPVGQAMEQAGNAGFEIASRMADAKIAADAAEASIKLRSRLDEEYRAIENDMEGDPAGFEAKFRERAAAIASEEAGRMSSPAMKRAFGAKSMELTETYSINMRDVTRRRQVEGIKAQALRMNADFELLANNPDTDPDTLEEARLSNLSMVDRYVATGIYTPDVAEAAKIALEEVHRVGVSNRVVTSITRYLDDDDYVRAEQAFLSAIENKQIDPAKKDIVHEMLKTKTREGEVITTADKLWGDSGQFLDVAMAEAYKITDPKKRVEVEVRLAQLNAQKVTGENARQEEVRKSGMEPILNGGDMGSIPAAVRLAADPDTLKYWQDLVDNRKERQERSAAMSAQQKAALKEYETNVIGSINALRGSDSDLYNQGPRAWRAEDPYLYAQYMSLDDGARQGIERAVESSRTSGGKASAEDALLSQLVNAAPTFGLNMTEMKMNDPDLYAQVIGSLYNAAGKEAPKLGGGDLTSTRRKEIFGAALANAYRANGEMKTGFSIAGVPLGPLAIALNGNTETEQRRAALQIAAALPRDYGTARIKLLDEGNTNPSEIEIAREALRMVEKRQPGTFTQGDR
jgi:hypothetical protein